MYHTCTDTQLQCVFIDLVNATSKQFDGGTSLHIAAANLSLQASRTLVSMCVYLWNCHKRFDDGKI